jgi:hypothetical protein
MDMANEHAPRSINDNLYANRNTDFAILITDIYPRKALQIYRRSQPSSKNHLKYKAFRQPSIFNNRPPCGPWTTLLAREKYAKYILQQ